jgi:glycosyltransferase involved in cell wall biosynthesis
LHRHPQLPERHEVGLARRCRTAQRGRPTVSAIIPNFNHASCVGAAIGSILGQGDEITELIVVDDASSDDSVAVIEAALRGSSRARLLRNETNRGAVETLNRGLTEATGDFVLLAAADDLYLPGMIAVCLEAAEAWPHAGFVCGNAAVRWPDGTRLSVPLPFGDRTRYVSPDEVLAMARQRNFFFYTGSALLRRDAILAAGGLIAPLRWHADWFLDFVLALRNGFVYLPHECSIMATSPTSYSQGRHHRRDQQQILQFLISTLRLRYPDVAPRFRAAALLPSFNVGFLRLLLSPGLRWYATALLIWRMIMFRPLRLCGRILPWPLRQALRGLFRV